MFFNKFMFVMIIVKIGILDWVVDCFFLVGGGEGVVFLSFLFMLFSFGERLLGIVLKFLRLCN